MKASGGRVICSPNPRCNPLLTSHPRPQTLTTCPAQVAADAFETLTCVLTTNKPVVFKWLNPDGDAASLTR